MLHLTGYLLCLVTSHPKEYQVIYPERDFHDHDHDPSDQSDCDLRNPNHMDPTDHDPKDIIDANYSDRSGPDLSDPSDHEHS